MRLDELQKHWDEFGRQDPLWAIRTRDDMRGNRWDPAEFFQTGRDEIDAVMNYLESLGVRLKRRRALDFGCGVGRLAQALCGYFNESVGVDIAPSMIERAKTYNRYGDKCRYVVNAANDLRLFSDGDFDFIYSVIVLQHMRPEYSKRYLREFLRVLSPGGVAVFQLPSEIRPVVDPSLPESAFNARIAVDEPPATLAAGSRATIRVTVRNLSDVVWPSRPSAGGSSIRLGNHWLNDRGKMIVRDDGRASLPADVLPLGEVRLDLTVTAPRRPGRYRLKLDLVWERVAWFEERGSATIEWPCVVRPSAQALIAPIVSRAGSILGRARREVTTPQMEMHAVPKTEVMAVVQQAGGRALDVQDDNWAGPAWISYRYCVERQ